MKVSTAAPLAATESVLLKQYKLIGAVIDAPWATRLDHKIARHVIDRYFAKFGNARASLSYLEQATGAKRTNIVESLRRISDPRRQGRRPPSLLRLAASPLRGVEDRISRVGMTSSPLPRTWQRQRTVTGPQSTQHPNQNQAVIHGCDAWRDPVRPWHAVLRAEQSLLYRRGQIQG